MLNYTEDELLAVASHFCLEGTPKECDAHGNGHINGTYRVETDSKRYILQRINTNVFPFPEQLMNNIVSVTEFLRRKDSDPRHVLSIVPAKDGKIFYEDNKGTFWRIYPFLENAICLELPESNEDFYQSAYAFGAFQRNLHDFPVEQLFAVIPDFHNTPKRYRDFLAAVEADVCGRAAGVQKEIEFVKARAPFYEVLEKAHAEGRLPLRVTHNDTKQNNVMLDAETRTALCVIDLDTIMPGYSVTDFGDAIRFGANTAVEDEKDLSKVSLDMELFDAYAKGFLEGAGGMLTAEEIRLLPEGAKMMTMECGMRFLADYLAGDTYFKTAYADHNLVRCRTQFRLTECMEDHWDDMKKCVEKYI